MRHIYIHMQTYVSLCYYLNHFMVHRATNACVCNKNDPDQSCPYGEIRINSTDECGNYI